MVLAGNKCTRCLFLLGCRELEPVTTKAEPLPSSSPNSGGDAYETSRLGRRTASMRMDGACQPFLPAPPLAFLKGFAALPALIATHRFFAASAIAFLPEALMLRFRSTTGAAGVFAALTAAQRFLAASAIAIRPAALKACLRATRADPKEVGPDVLGARPRRFVELCSA